MIGGDSTGVPYHVFCHDEWRDKYGIRPPWGNKEFAQLAQAYKRFENDGVARSTWKLYLASGDEFYQGHEPGKFLASLSRWIVKAPKPKKAASFPGAARAAAMAKVVREVHADPAIPGPMKQDEMKKRWAMIPIDL